DCRSCVRAWWSIRWKWARSGRQPALTRSPSNSSPEHHTKGRKTGPGSNKALRIMASFFIDRPVFAWVIAITIMLAGLLSITQLPVEQYPAIAPPSVTVTAVYPGASARTVENAVTQVIEQ